MAQHHDFAILCFSEDPDSVRFKTFTELRGFGVLSFDASIPEITAAIGAVKNGLAVVPMHNGAKLVNQKTASNDHNETESMSLTPREDQVLKLLAGGLLNKEIAAMLGISENTVKYHITSIFGKLGVSNRTEAVLAGIRLGFLEL